MPKSEKSSWICRHNPGVQKHSVRNNLCHLHYVVTAMTEQQYSCHASDNSHISTLLQYLCVVTLWS